MISLARSNSSQFSYGSAGAGSSVHLAGVLLEKTAKISLVHVPFKGSGPAFNDLLGGHLNILFADIPQVAAHIKSGRVKALAVTTPKRSTAMPEMPTIAESGLSGYSVPVWYGVFGPAGMPKDVTGKLSSVLKDILLIPLSLIHISEPTRPY